MKVSIYLKFIIKRITAQIPAEIAEKEFVLSKFQLDIIELYILCLI